MSHLFEPFKGLKHYREVAGGFWASCPAHDERTASFHGTLKEGKLLIKCFACGASAKALLQAMRLPWSALFADGKPPTRQALDAARQAREARERETALKMDEYFAIAADLDERDAITALDWSGYADGPEAIELLMGLQCDRSYLEWRLDVLAGDLKI